MIKVVHELHKNTRKTNSCPVSVTCNSFKNASGLVRCRESIWFTLINWSMSEKLWVDDGSIKMLSLIFNHYMMDYEHKLKYLNTQRRWESAPCCSLPSYKRHCHTQPAEVAMPVAEWMKPLIWTQNTFPTVCIGVKQLQMKRTTTWKNMYLYLLKLRENTKMEFNFFAGLLKISFLTQLFFYSKHFLLTFLQKCFGMG